MNSTSFCLWKTQTFPRKQRSDLFASPETVPNGSFISKPKQMIFQNSSGSSGQLILQWLERVILKTGIQVRQSPICDMDDKNHFMV